MNPLDVELNSTSNKYPPTYFLNPHLKNININIEIEYCVFVFSVQFTPKLNLSDIVKPSRGCILSICKKYEHATTIS